MEARFDTFAERLDKVADKVEQLDLVVNTDEGYYEEEEDEGMRINDEFADALAVDTAVHVQPPENTVFPATTESTGVVPGHGYSLRTRAPKARITPYS